MASINLIIIIGYMGKDAHVTTTQGGIKVAHISVGTTERGFTAKDGTQIPDKTDWHNVVLWKQSADFAEKYAKKGMQVYVRGKLRHRNYQDKDGTMRYTAEIEAEDFQILERAQPKMTNAAPLPTAQQPIGYSATDNSNLPF